MGGIIIKRKIRLERENKSKRIFIKSIWLISARHEVEQSALQGKRWCWTGGVLFNSASEDCMHFWFYLHVRHIHLFWVHKCEKRGWKREKHRWKPFALPSRAFTQEYVADARVHSHLINHFPFSDRCTCDGDVFQIRYLMRWYWKYGSENNHVTVTLLLHTHARRWASVPRGMSARVARFSQQNPPNCFLIQSADMKNNPRQQC